MQDLPGNVPFDLLIVFELVQSLKRKKKKKKPNKKQKINLFFFL